MITGCRCAWPPDAGISFMGKMQCGRWMTAANVGMNTIEGWPLTFFFSRTLHKHLFYGLIYFQIRISGSRWERLLRRNLKDETWYNSSASLWCFLIIASIRTGVTGRHTRRKLTHFRVRNNRILNSNKQLSFSRILDNHIHRCSSDFVSVWVWVAQTKPAFPVITSFALRKEG